MVVIFTMEYYNQKSKQPFESRDNMFKKESLLGRLNTQLWGKIEWYFDADIEDHNTSDF